MTPHTLRSAKPSDLAPIETLLLGSDLPTDGVDTILSRNPLDFLVAESDGRVVGVAGLEVCGDNALLRSVAVLPEWRSSGVGRELVHGLIESAESRGIHALYLLTQTAEKYFPRFGFERIQRESVPPEVAETAEFKSLCPSSAVVMKRECATH